MLAKSTRLFLQRTVLSVASLGAIAAAGSLPMIVAVPDAAQAKAPGAKYCFYSRCHRVKTIRETAALIGKDVMLHASHYSACEKDPYNPCGLTSSGEKFHPLRPDNAASPIYPDGTKLLVRHPGTGESAVLRINNAGPYWGNRKLDVSYATAERLGFRGKGVAKLETRIVHAPSAYEARYSRNRRYEPVAGHLGKFESLDAAEEALTAIDAVRAMAASAFAPASAAVVATAQAETLQADMKRQAMAEKTEPMLALLNQFDAVESIAVASVSPAELLQQSEEKIRKAAPLRVASLGGSEAAVRRAVRPGAALLGPQFSRPVSLSTAAVDKAEKARPAAQLAAALASEVEALSPAAPTGELVRTADAGAFGTMSQDIQEELLIQRFRRMETSRPVRFGGGLPWPDRNRHSPRDIPGWPNTARGGALG